MGKNETEETPRLLTKGMILCEVAALAAFTAAFPIVRWAAERWFWRDVTRERKFLLFPLHG